MSASLPIVDGASGQDSRAARWRGVLSNCALLIAAGALAANFLLLSPPRDGGYPGAIPWAPNSILHRLTDILSVGGLACTARGVEIKDFAFYGGSAIMLLILAARAVVSALAPPDRRTAKGAWFVGMGLLLGWVAVSTASAMWSRNPEASLGQAAIYGLGLAFAISLAWTIESRDVPRLLWSYIGIATAGATLCIWYYHERNPYHRPGFPIGNPSALATCILPAILLCVASLLGTLQNWRVGRRSPLHTTLAALLALIPLTWCFLLTDSRGAFVAAIGAALGVWFILTRARTRLWLIVATLIGLGVAGFWYADAAHELAMARGATLRFRYYAWQYAAQIWWQRPVSGVGAGGYPFLAGYLAEHDRTLDPAAFLGDLIEHAHNELFEIFAEIGLVGGVTYVAGFVATVAAASAMLRANFSPQRGWLMLGLTAGVFAMLVDSLTGVALRLPGAPAVFYLLLGLLWSTCRSLSRRADPNPDAHAPAATMRRFAVATAATLAAAGAGFLAIRNWNGALAEERAIEALAGDDFATASAETELAGARLLDPVRKLFAAERRVTALFLDSRASFAVAGAPTSSGPEVGNRLPSAIHRAEVAFEAALNLASQAPSLGTVLPRAAQSAEMLAAMLHASGDDAAAEQWQLTAAQVWMLQRQKRPYDATALLALTRYPLSTSDGLGLLRDALRNGFPPPGWPEALQRLARLEDFESTLAAMIQSVGPLNPQTDANSLAHSRAPEMHRLAGAWNAARGDFEKAAAHARLAAEMYAALRTRFPSLHSVALCEEAMYLLRSDLRRAPDAIALCEQAVRELPVIQEQEYNEQAAPMRYRLAQALVASDEQARALATLQPSYGERSESVLVAAILELAQSYYRRSTAAREQVNPWLDAALAHEPAHFTAWALKAWMALADGGPERLRSTLDQAAAAGLSPDQLDQIERSLRQEFPASEPAGAAP